MSQRPTMAEWLNTAIKWANANCLAALIAWVVLIVIVVMRVYEAKPPMPLGLLPTVLGVLVAWTAIAFGNRTMYRLRTQVELAKAMDGVHADSVSTQGPLRPVSGIR